MNRAPIFGDGEKRIVGKILFYTDVSNPTPSQQGTVVELIKMFESRWVSSICMSMAFEI